jgi:uncharacterized membrane protein YjgN (DUF898 family)
VVASAEMNDSAVEASQRLWRREQFEFRGNAKEYFGIWIVNVLLTIVTLGIYSAWATVRRRRYFYGNTFLAGASFDYHARPLQILIGRIIVVALLVAYNLSLQILPIVGLVIFLAFVFLIPWFVMRGLRFNARVTSYRNVRFDFTGTYGGAFLAYVVGTVLIYASAGILAPLASRWMWTYTLGNLHYGDRPIKCDPRLGNLYRQWWLPAVIMVGGMALLIGSGVLAFLTAESQMLDTWLSWPVLLLILIYIPIIALYFITALVYRAGVRNVALNETVIDGRHLLASSIHRGRYLWISVTNLFATLFTLGLARPWAAVRMAKYLAVVTALDATSSLDAYFGAVKNSGSAIGSEYMDVEGFDFGF